MKIIGGIFLCICFIEINCLGLPPSLQKQNQFTLNGRFSDMDKGFVILRYPDAGNRLVVDTSSILNGKFIFTGYINEPTLATLSFSGHLEVTGVPNVATFYLEPTEMSVVASADALRNAVFKGSNTQKTYQKFLVKESKIFRKWKDTLEKRERILNAYSLASEDSLMLKSLEDSLLKLDPQMEAFNKEMGVLQYQFIVENPDTYVSAHFLTSFRKRVSLEFEKKIYDGFREEIKKSKIGRYINNDIYKRSLVAVGSPASDFLLQNINEKKFHLSDLKGKYVLIDFWASWCVPCRQAIPSLKSFYEEYHAKGFEIVTISIDRKDSDWKQALKEEQIPQFYNILFDNEIIKNYENVFLPIPSQILLDRKGIIIWKRGYEEQTDNKSLETVLGEVFTK